MIYIKSREEFLKEQFLKEQFLKDKYITDETLIIKAGTKLYHSTIENFEPEKLGVGGYDKILWTTQDPKISNLYIPASSGTISTSSSSIGSIKQYMEDPSIANSLGIFYTIKNDTIIIDLGIFQEFSDICEKRENEEYEISKKLERAKELFNQYKVKSREIYKNEADLTDEELDTFDKEFNDVEEEKIRLEKYLDNFFRVSKEKYNLDNYKNKYINSRLEDMGYKPRYEDNYKFDNQWKLKYDSSGILPANYQKTGKMFILSPIRDLKILDKTNNETIDPDLTELDYHRHDWFEKALNDGYDGIKIGDFAQSEIQGNVGHYSIGLFKHVIKDLEKNVVNAKHIS